MGNPFFERTTLTGEAGKAKGTRIAAFCVQLSAHVEQ